MSYLQQERNVLFDNININVYICAFSFCLIYARIIMPTRLLKVHSLSILHMYMLFHNTVPNKLHFLQMLVNILFIKKNNVYLLLTCVMTLIWVKNRRDNKQHTCYSTYLIRAGAVPDSVQPIWHSEIAICIFTANIYYKYTQIK